MNEIDSQKGKFLMRRIEYTPDVVNIYCDIRIKWLQEIYFKSVIEMPKMLFNEDSFKEVNIFKKHISIEQEQWNDFVSKLVSIFRNNVKLRDEVIKNVNEYLEKAENYITKIYNNLYLDLKLPSVDEVKKCLEFFICMDSFAVFNMFIPSNYYENILESINMPKEYINIDLVMICSFMPHRIQVRKNKLELLRKFIENNEDIDIEIKKYMQDYAVYEKFEELAFDNSILKNANFIKNDLNRMKREYTIKDIENELQSIEYNRKNQINKLYEFYNVLENKMNECNMTLKEKKEFVEKFSFLTLIVSEEEKRHMIECKIFAIISEVLKSIKIDISRAAIYEIIETYRCLKGE